MILNKLTLGQLAHLSRVARMLKAGEGDVLTSLAWIMDQDVKNFSKADMKAAIERSNNLFQSACNEYIQIVQSDVTQTSFKCCPTHPGELELLKESKFLGRRWKLYKAIQPIEFTIKEDIEQEPAEIWVMILDGALKRVGELEDNEFYRQWEEIPAVLSALAWRKKESRYKNDAVDVERIKSFAEIFLYMNALDAVKCFNHFLSKSGLSFKGRNLQSSSKKETQNTVQAQSK